MTPAVPATAHEGKSHAQILISEILIECGSIKKVNGPGPSCCLVAWLTHGCCGVGSEQALEHLNESNRSNAPTSEQELADSRKVRMFFEGRLSVTHLLLRMGRCKQALEVCQGGRDVKCVHPCGCAMLTVAMGDSTPSPSRKK